MEEKKMLSALKELRREFAVVVEGKVVEFTIQDILDLIERQKAEIKRMKIWLKTLQADMKLEVGIRDRENAELQKQVDDLTKKCSEIYWFKQYEKAEKDTAKEIFEKLLGFMGSKQKFVIVNDDHKTLIDCDELFGFVGRLAKEKGVEVE